MKIDNEAKEIIKAKFQEYLMKGNNDTDCIAYGIRWTLEQLNLEISGVTDYKIYSFDQ